MVTPIHPPTLLADGARNERIAAFMESPFATSAVSHFVENDDYTEIHAYHVVANMFKNYAPQGHSTDRRKELEDILFFLGVFLCPIANHEGDLFAYDENGHLHAAVEAAMQTHDYNAIHRVLDSFCSSMLDGCESIETTMEEEFYVFFADDLSEDRGESEALSAIRRFWLYFGINTTEGGNLQIWW